jgi:fibronectin type 3 domain-containing protein
MNKQFKLLFLIIAVATFSQHSKAQSDTSSINNSIGLIGKYNGRSIVLRWAPADNASFFLLKKYGYKLERAITAKDGKPLRTKAQFSTIGIFKPADSMTWAKRVDKTNNYQVIAAHCALSKIYAPLPQNPNFGEIMKRLNEERNLHGFAAMAADFDTTAANLLGLRFEDKNIEANATYLYVISSLVPKSELDIDGNFVFIDSRKDTIPVPPSLYDYGAEKHIRLDWYHQYYGKFYSAYHIERGDANGKNFKRITRFPMITVEKKLKADDKLQMTYIDSVPVDYVKYTYRLIGITPFAEYSEPGPTIVSFGRDRTPPIAAHSLSITDVNQKYLNLTWKKDFFEPDFVGFNVLRANNQEGPYYPINEKILTKNELSFLDKTPDDMNGGFYRIETVDTANNKNWSLGMMGFLKDTVPPSKPIGLSGKADVKGVVTLKWNLGPEKDIKGYRIYYANQIDHEFTILTGDLYQDTVYTDTVNINRLTEQIYYQIAAADRHYNHSERSTIIKVALPDTVKPVKPLFKNILVTDTAIHISWIPSDSKDVMKHNIYRKVGNGEYQLWKTINDRTVRNITDNQVTIGEVYSYKIEAVDDVELSSGFPLEVSGKVYDVGKRKPVTNFSANWVKEKKTVMLKWNYPPSDKYHFVIYRSYNNSTFRAYKSAKGTENQFEDWDLLGPGTYVYAVVAIYKDGGSSGLTSTVTVIVP